MNRAILALAGLSGLTTLASCVPDTPPVAAATPPTVAYRVSGTDISQANVSAAQYCGRYGSAPQYQGLQATSSGNVALYSCSGAPVAASGSSVPPPAYNAPPAYSPSYDPSYAAPAPFERCADKLHQDRPGGTDYYGPPLPGCPQLQ